VSGDHAHLHAHGTQTRRAALASVAMALFLLGLKGWATMSTGSVAMLGSLADTGLDILASLVTLWGVWLASQPADSEHRFGHGKAEALAAMFQAALIAMSAVAIGWRAVGRLAAPVEPARAELGIGVSLVAIVTTLALVAYQSRIVRRTGSVAIATDSLHYKSDVALNASVIAALALESFVGLRGADPVFGLGIALWLLWSARNAAKGAIDALMDREWAPARRAALVALFDGHRHAGGIHDVRTRTSGATDFIQFHLWLPPEMTVRAAHDVIEEMEDRVRAAHPGAEVLIHVDPAGHIDKGEIDHDA
jgi:ferrous-iron efflux pump FieF